MIAGGILQDGIFALRSLRKDLRFSLAVVLTLAVSMGALTTMFSLIDAVILKPLPFAEADRLVALWDSRPDRGVEKTCVSASNYLHWREQNHVFSQIALISQAPLTITGLEQPLQLTGSLVTEDFFPMLGIKPLHGRTFQADDFQPSGDPVVLLSHSFWTSFFGADPGAVGRTVRLNDQPYTIIGVMPSQIYPLTALPSGRWEFRSKADHLWVPVPTVVPDRAHVSGVLARLREGVSPARAREELRTIARRLEQEFPDTNQGYTVELVPLTEEAVGDVRTGLWMLLGAVGLLLLIACANISTLFLVRAVARSQEIAVRAALGADRGRIFRLFLTDGAVLMLVGMLGGLLASRWLLHLLPRLSPENIPRLDEAVLDLRVLTATVVVCILSILVLSIIPTIQVGWRSLRTALEEGGRGGGLGTRSSRILEALVVGEMALAVVLVIGSGLLIRSFQHLQSVDLGFEARQLLILELQHAPVDYPEMHHLTGFYEEFLNQVRSIPGVLSAAAAYDHPLVSNWFQSFRIEDGPEPPPGEKPQALFRTVTPEYMDTLGLQLVKGRNFRAGDDANSPGVVMVNRAMVRRYFPDQLPLGRRLSISTTQWMWGEVVPRSFEIIGIVHDVRATGLDADCEPAFYLPYRQTPHRRMTVLIHTEREPRAILPEVRKRLWSIAPHLPIVLSATLEEVLAEMVAKPRFHVVVLGIFSATSLLLSVIGLLGVVSNSVLQRLHEIGIRMAFGADRKSILNMVTWDGMKPALLGVGLGIVGAFLFSRLLAGLLFGISPTDPTTYIMIPLCMVLIALAACIIPAVKASRCTPMRVLRNE